MKTKILLAVVLLTGAITLQARNSSQYSDDGYNNYSYNENSETQYQDEVDNDYNNYGRKNSSNILIVPVTKSIPQYRNIMKRHPYQECWNERVPVTSSGSNNVGALIGGVAGGILGHQVGGGSGKTAATVGGAIVGTLVGKNLSENDSNTVQYRTIRKCKNRKILYLPI